MIRGRAFAVFGPALRAYQGNEHDAAEIFLLIIGLALARNLEKLLLALIPTHRNDQTTADRELILQSARHLGSACCHKNGVERRRLWPSTCAIADAQVDVVVAELTEPAPSRLGERRMAFDGVDVVCNPADHRCGVA